MSPPAPQTGELRLAEGRIVRFFRFGDPGGRPLFYCHGWPGSGIQAALAEPAARRLGFSILSPDRPGIGGSTFAPDRRIVDWPAVAAQLADAEGWDRFDLLAVSGGCPYALATARALPERIGSVHVCCGAAPPEFLLREGLSYPIYRVLLRLHRSARTLLLLGLQMTRLYFRALPNSAAFLPILPFLSGADARAVRPRANRTLLARSVAAAFRQHPRGVLRDATRFVEEWGFPLREVRVPVRFHHGTADRNIPIEAARQTAARIPGSQFTEWEGEGHYSLPLNRLETIIGAIAPSR